MKNKNGYWIGKQTLTKKFVDNVGEPDLLKIPVSIEAYQLPVTKLFELINEECLKIGINIFHYGLLGKTVINHKCYLIFELMTKYKEKK